MSGLYFAYAQAITLIFVIALVFAVSYTVSGRADVVGVVGVTVNVLAWLGLDQIDQNNHKITQILLGSF